MANTTNTTTTTVMNLADLTRKNCAFAGCSLIKPDSDAHPKKGDVKGREFILVPFTKFDGATFATFANLDAVTLPKLGGFAIMLKGAGGKTAYEPAEQFARGMAEIASVQARMTALRAELGSPSDEVMGEVMANFTGTFAQRILATLNRADAIRASGGKVTRENLKPEKKTA